MKHCDILTSHSRRSFQTSPRINQAVIMRMKREEHIKRIDKIERDSELIYRIPLNYSLNFGKLLSSVTVGGISILCVYELLQVKNLFSNESPGTLGELVADTSDLPIFIMGFFVINIAFVALLRLLPLRIYRSGENYTAILTGILPMTNPRLYFKKGDLIENFQSKISFDGASYKLRNRHIILIENRFRRPSDLYSMLPESQSKVYSK